MQARVVNHSCRHPTHFSVRGFEVTGFSAMIRARLSRCSICSYFRPLPTVSHPSRTRVSSTVKSKLRFEVLLCICIGVSVLFCLFSYNWQIFELDSFRRYASLLRHQHDASCELEFRSLSKRDNNGEWQNASSKRSADTTKGTHRTLQPNGHIHSPCKPASTSADICHETAFRRWHTFTGRKRSFSSAHGVWMLLSRRKHKNMSPLLTGGTPKQRCCHLSGAERQLSAQKLSLRDQIPAPLSRVLGSSSLLLRSPAAYPRRSVVNSQLDPTDPEHPPRVRPLPHAPQASQTGRQSHKSIENLDSNDLTDGRRKLASLFDIWQQLEPLTSETKQFIVERLTEKAVSHVVWFYEWQRKNAIPLLVQYLLHQGEGTKHTTDSYDAALETDYSYIEDDDKDDDDDDDDDEDDYGDEDDEYGAEDDGEGTQDTQPAEGGFRFEHLTSKGAILDDEKVTPGHDKRTRIHLEHIYAEKLVPIQGRHDGTAVFSDRSAGAAADHSLYRRIRKLDRERALSRRAKMSVVDEEISTAGNANLSYDARYNAEDQFITPDSNTWFSEVEIDQEYYNAGVSVLGNALSALVTKDIPNITVTIDRLNQHIGTYLQRYKDAVWSLPLQQIVNATLNGGMFPSLVELQNASYPDFKRDVRCNPGVQVCQNLGGFLRAVGGLFRRVYHSTYLYNVHLRAEAAASLLHTLVVGQRVTPTFFSFVEQIVTVAMLETVLNATTSLIEIPADSQFFAFINAVLSFIGEVYSLADMPAEEKEQMNLMRSKVRTAVYCRIFNGRLPYCTPSPATLIPSPEVPRELLFDPYTGFVKFLYFNGFEAACIQRGGCFADLFIEGENFDGFYFLLGVGSTGFPVYQGYRYFQRFLELTRLFFWQGLRPSVVDDSQGSWAGITSVPESYFTSTRGQLNPFASLATLTPPNNCSDFPPVPFGDITTEFPLCLNVSRQWVLGRVAALGNCNGFLYSHVCVFPSTVVIFPTTSPVLWTAATTTSTVAPPSTAPRQPPGGGVPPGGTSQDARTSIVPSSKKEEGHLEEGSRAEYLFWEEADSPFDTAYPWERKNLISGWTAKRRRIRERADRRLAIGPVSLAAPLKLTDTKESSRLMNHKGNTASTANATSHLIPAARQQPRFSQVRDQRNDDYGLRIKKEYRLAIHTPPAVEEESVFVPQLHLLHGEAAKRAVAKRLEGLNGINGRRFQSSIPVHRSQFVDGFSGKLVFHIPPFFPVPPDLL